MREDREAIFAREGRAFPGATYKEAVLEDAYRHARDNLLDAMLAANRAHLIMLSEQGLIPQEDAARVMAAIVNLDERAIRGSSYTGSSRISSSTAR